MLDMATQPTSNGLIPRTLVPRSPDDSPVLLLDPAKLGKIAG
jgi:hypothetical protein